jgi:hypothetical protein
VFLATVTLTGWLLLRGVDVAKWQEMTRANNAWNTL